MTTIPKDVPPVGLNLRKLRQDAGLSLSQTADLTGVSKAMLGQIERAESSPTLATLWKLAKGFQVPLSGLIDMPTDASPRFVPATSTAKQFGPGHAFHTVFPFDPAIGSETFLHEIAPGLTHLSQPHVTGVVEDVFVLEGSIEILHAEKWHPVHAREGLRFAADQPHGYRNTTDQPARFHNVMHYPKS